MTVRHWSLGSIMLEDSNMLEDAGWFTRGCTQPERPWLFSLVAPFGLWLCDVLITWGTRATYDFVSTLVKVYIFDFKNAEG